MGLATSVPEFVSPEERLRPSKRIDFLEDFSKVLQTDPPQGFSESSAGFAKASRRVRADDWGRLVLEITMRFCLPPLASLASWLGERACDSLRSVFSCGVFLQLKMRMASPETHLPTWIWVCAKIWVLVPVLGESIKTNEIK
ncbi:unnamed protein product [Durusdinium trenchii]|uniref:Uncharacterized protein n=1 Tax=Durusdinium trenchii TaxID=1381693 RepID=A0ABP0NZ65_9DINO